MSRCFPFPPPGYEKKARTDDPDILKKERQREKKHKKEKDKEKRESKEKKEKDRNDAKPREKKDKKEKNREKKEKERDKDRDKNSNSDEKRLIGKSEGHGAEKTSHEKKLPTKSEGHNGEKFSQKKERDKDISSISREKKVGGQFSGYSAEKPSQNSYLAGDSKDSIFLQELGRVRAEETGMGNLSVEKFAGTNQKRNEGMVRLVAKATASLDEGKEKKKDKRGGNDRKPDEQGIGDEAWFTGSVMVQSLPGMVQERAEGMPKRLAKDVESRTEAKEKTKRKERDGKHGDKEKTKQKEGDGKHGDKEKTKQKEGDDKHGDKRKDKDREKKVQGKDKDRDKKKKEKEKEKMKSEHKNTEKDILKDSDKDELVGTNDKKTLHLPKDCDKNVISEGNPRKRKDIETNGFCHDNDIRPNKLPRPTSSSNQLTETNKLPRPTSSSHSLTETNKFLKPTSSSHPLTGNGKILESCQASVLFTSDRQGTANNPKADNKEQKVNGIIVSQPLPVSISKPMFMTAQADQIGEVSTKLPHPDTKYLDQVLSVPNEGELSDFDDLEWLFHGSDLQSKKPEMGSSENDETTKVWAEVMRIESADIYALPYVTPF